MTQSTACQVWTQLNQVEIPSELNHRTEILSFALWRTQYLSLADLRSFVLEVLAEMVWIEGAFDLGRPRNWTGMIDPRIRLVAR